MLAHPKVFAASQTPAARDKNARARRGRGSGKSYPKLNGRHAHRVIAEQKIGRALRPGEVVHHKDENILNYAPDNLDVLSGQGEHNRLHFSGVKREPKTLCKNGHPLYGANVKFTSSGRRRCVTCERIYANQWNKQKRRLRGLKRPGPKPGTPGAMAIADSNRRRGYHL